MKYYWCFLEVVKALQGPYFTKSSYIYVSVRTDTNECFGCACITPPVLPN